MKRFLTVVLIVGLLAGFAAVATAGPVNVGGGYSAFTSQAGAAPVFPGRGIGYFPGKGGPFLPVPEASFLLSPVNVGGG